VRPRTHHPNASEHQIVDGWRLSVGVMTQTGGENGSLPTVLTCGTDNH